MKSIVLKSIPAIDTQLLSEKALSIDWNRPEEDETWASLQVITENATGELI